MSKESELSGTVDQRVIKIGSPVTAADVDTYAKLRGAIDRSHGINTIFTAWEEQQKQERQMREKYALALIVAMFVQGIVINIIFVAIGVGKLTYEAWTARVFVMAVFAELAAMVFFIVKYLFRPAADKVLELAIEKPRQSQRRGRKQNGD